MKIFVYGTLMRGHYNNVLLRQHSANFLQQDAVAGYAMYSLGAYPCITRTPAGFLTQAMVHGELWECNMNCVKQLDSLEGHPNFYRRETVDLAYSPGEAYAYVMTDKHMSNYITWKRARLISSGRWTLEQYDVHVAEVKAAS